MTCIRKSWKSKRRNRMEVTRRGFVGGLVSVAVCPLALFGEQHKEKKPIRTDLPMFFEIEKKDALPPPTVPLEDIVWENLIIKYRNEDEKYYKVDRVEWDANPNGDTYVHMYDNHFLISVKKITVRGPNSNGRPDEDRNVSLKIYYKERHDTTPKIEEPFPLDYMAPGSKEDYVPYVTPAHGRIPEKSGEV